jgi:hypothetical protein
MTQQEFNIEIETKAQPPKGWVWKFLGGVIKTWLYNNADAVLIVLLTLILGADKAQKVIDIINKMKL